MLSAFRFSSRVSGLLLLVLACLLAMPLTPCVAAPAETDEVQAVAELLLQRHYTPLQASRLLEGARQGLRRVLPVEAPSVADWDDLQRLCLQPQDPIQRQAAQRAAIEGMVEAVADPYTDFMSAEDFARFLATMSEGDFGGVGLLIDRIDTTAQLIVLDVITGTPAQQAGLRAGSEILAVDGIPAKELSLTAARDALVGNPGELVQLVVEQAGQRLTVNLVRARVAIPSVESSLHDVAGVPVGYVKIRLFGDETARECGEALAALEDQGAGAYVLDLRNNGGGYLHTAIEICSMFLEPGTRVVTVRERQRAERVLCSAAGSREFRGRLVLLVNQHSASASEVTAAGLRDNGRALLVGTRSFGKSTVQTLLRLPDDSALKLTTAHYFTPRGVDLNGIGLKPDIPIATSLAAIRTADDRQLHEALRLASGRSLSSTDGGASRDDAPPGAERGGL